MRRHHIVSSSNCARKIAMIHEYSASLMSSASQDETANLPPTFVCEVVAHACCKVHSLWNNHRHAWAMAPAWIVLKCDQRGKDEDLEER